MMLATTAVNDKKSKDSVDSIIKTRQRHQTKHAESSGADEQDKLLCIAVTAYYKAESRGFEPGHEIQDWLEAEAEVVK